MEQFFSFLNALLRSLILNVRLNAFYFNTDFQDSLVENAKEEASSFSNIIAQATK